MTREQLNWRLDHCDSQDDADEAQEQFDWDRETDEINASTATDEED